MHKALPHNFHEFNNIVIGHGKVVELLVRITLCRSGIENLKNLFGSMGASNMIYPSPGNCVLGASASIKSRGRTLDPTGEVRAPPFFQPLSNNPGAPA